MKVFKSHIENTSIFLTCEDSSGNVYQSKMLISSEAEYVALLARLKMRPDDKVMLDNNITTADMVYVSLSRRMASRIKK